MRIVPDWLPWLGRSGGQCCRMHDDLYCYGGTERDRQWADVQFMRCIRERVTDRAWPVRMWGNFVGDLHYRAVRRFGAQRFNYWASGKAD